ncbi:MAG: VWA domain-containing protein [Treponema sp.]|jgi:hypothetical protein|nr:VWA domain-containing protein [Treponema sp.]
MEKRILLSLAVVYVCCALGEPLYAQDLSIGPNDLRIEQRVDGGFHLFIRKKPDIGSVLLTESTRDPTYTLDSYAYRAAEWNAINGDEVRLINGSPISPESRIYSLIASNSEIHPELGPAFHIYIPYLIYYGYDDGRHGEVYVVNGTYFNIRAFQLPYGDYRGAFRENPFVLEVTQQPLSGPPEGNYMKDTIEAFTEIAGSNTQYSRGSSDLVNRIRGILEKEKNKNVDIVICLDTTGSMRNDITAIRQQLPPLLREMTADFASFRIGVVLFKDYHEEYITRVIPFTNDFSLFQRNLNAIRVGGGGDIPEAVHEALYEGAVKFPWAAESKIMLLIGDAPPHPRPRGRITKEMVDQEILERGIETHAIILPQ